MPLKQARISIFKNFRLKKKWLISFTIVSRFPVKLDPFTGKVLSSIRLKT